MQPRSAHTIARKTRFGIIYVPIGGGLMQPYERPRTGDLAGTTGNRAPSSPVATSGPRARAATPYLRDPDRLFSEEPSATKAIRFAAGRSIVEPGTAGSSRVLLNQRRLDYLSVVRPP